MASEGGTGEGSPEQPAEGPAEKSSGLPFEQSSLVQRVRALTEALEGSDISELELHEGGARILIRRQLEAPVIGPLMQSRPRAAGRGAPPRRAHSGEHQERAPAEAPPGIAVLAPLTGVFYGSPSPSAPSFVQVGDTVQAGQVVCLVEAMKVFNEIKAEISGTVAAIVATSGQLVTKGSPLIRIQPI
jgi:acetyl-CoA carboxylase biotin carboxyl carrier protein